MLNLYLNRRKISHNHVLKYLFLFSKGCVMLGNFEYILEKYDIVKVETVTIVEAKCKKKSNIKKKITLKTLQK